MTWWFPFVMIIALIVGLILAVPPIMFICQTVARSEQIWDNFAKVEELIFAYFKWWDRDKPGGIANDYTGPSRRRRR